MRPTTSIAAVAVAAAAVAVAAVGTMLTAETSSAAPLGPERLAALDRMYTAMLPLDDSEVSLGTLDRIHSACGRLDRADALLDAKRLECFGTVRFTRFSVQQPDRCGKESRCLSVYARFARALKAFVARLRTTNRAVETAVAAPGCRSALRTSARDLRVLERLGAASRRYARTGKFDDLLRLADLLTTEDLVTVTQKRKRLRDQCGQAGTATEPPA